MPVAVETRDPSDAGASVGTRVDEFAAGQDPDGGRLAAPTRRTVYRRPRRRTRSALDVLVVGALAYGGAAVLNAHHLHRRAERMPLDASTRRPLAAAAGVVEKAGALVGLDRPGRRIDTVRGVKDPLPTPHGVAAALVVIDANERPAVGVGRALAERAVNDAHRAAAAADTAGRLQAELADRYPAFRAPSWLRPLPEDLADPHHRAGRNDVAHPDRPTASTSAASTPAAPTSGSSTSGSSTSAASISAAGGPTDPDAAAASRKPPVNQLRTATAADPWRVYVGGDSLAQGIGPALARLGTDSGLMAVAPHGVLSSGLARPDAFDWPSALSTAAAGNDEIVVLVFGANDPQTMSTGSSSIQFGTPEWEAEYARRVREVLDVLAGKTVVWIGLPVVGRPDLERQLQVLDRVYREQAANRPNVSYIDVRALTSTDGTSYQPYLDGGDGQQFLARTNDKVHFTSRGYDLVAQAVAMRLMQLTTP